MKTLRIFILSICTLVFLTACKFNVISAVHMTSLRDVAFSEHTNVTTPTTVEIQIPSKNECDDYAIAYINFIEEFVSKAANRGCLKKGSESYLLIEVQTPIVYGLEAWEDADALFGTMLVSTDGPVSVYMMSNVAMYEKLVEKMQREFNQTPDITKSNFTIFLNNFRQHEYLLVKGVFLNSEPIDNYEEVEYRRRRRLSVGLSNVGIAHLEKQGYALTFVFKN